MTEQHKEPRYEVLDIKKLIPTLDNPRQIDEKSESFKKLRISIKANGVKIPVIVRPHPEKDGCFDLRAGARRTRAAHLEGLKVIPSLVHDEMTDQEAFDITFLENFAREDLNPIEESKAVAILLDKYGQDLKVVADKFDKTPRWVKLRSHVHANLHPKWASAVLDEKSDFSALTINHLELIARFDKETQEHFFEEIGYHHCPGELTVKQLDQWLAERMMLLKKAKWDLQEVFIDEAKKKICSCADCPKRSDKQPMLFEDGGDAKTASDARCLDERCWNTKWMLWMKHDIAARQAEHPGLVLCILEAPHDERKKFKAIFENVQDYQYEYQIKTAKKGENGAYPCYVICGKSAGQLVWRKNTSNRGRGTSGNQKKGTKTLAQKRTELKKKRWNHVLKELVVKFGETPALSIVHDEKVRAIQTLVSVFGTCSEYKIVTSRWTDYDKGMKGKLSDTMSSDLFEKVWRLVRPKIIDTFRYNDAITQVPDYKIENAKHAAALVGIDIEAMFTAAVEAIPEPKSWTKDHPAADNADTENAPAPKKAKKTPSKSAKKTTVKKKTTKKKPAKKR